ncbi:hypothetical protein D3C78_1400540 [compost metagenome]
MAGKVQALIDKILEKKAKGNPALIQLTKAKLVMKGIDPDKFNASSPDDPSVLDKLEKLAAEMGLALHA